MVLGVLFQEAENQIFPQRQRLQRKLPSDYGYRSFRRLKLRNAGTMAALQLCQLEDVADAHLLDLHTAQRRMVAVRQSGSPQTRYSTAG